MSNCVKCGRKLPPFTFGKKLCKWCIGYYAVQNGEISEGEVQPVMPAPWTRTHTGPSATTVLVGLNALVFAAMAVSGISPLDPTGQQLVNWGANWGPLTLGAQWWRLLSNTFLHIGLLHILFNMWCLWDLGALAESLYGAPTFIAVYLLAGIGGSLVSVWWHPLTVSAGASGAIFGIAGALIGSLYLGEFSLPSGAIRGTLRSVVVFVGYNLAFGIVGNIDNAAHIGGFLTGLALGALIARVAPERNDLVRRITILALMALVLAGFGLWVRHRYVFLTHPEQESTLQAPQIEMAALSHFTKSALLLDLSRAEERAKLSGSYVGPGIFAAHYTPTEQT